MPYVFLFYQQMLITERLRKILQEIAGMNAADLIEARQAGKFKITAYMKGWKPSPGWLPAPLCSA